MKIILRVFTVVYTCVAFSSVFAEQIRDYYAEPGINPFKDSLNQNFHEYIDPFGGMLQHKYIDLKIPGAGGLDINITRTYSSQQERLGIRGVNGVGWSMHFGRVLVSASTNQDAINRMCQGQGTNQIDSTDNPSLEFPDGSRELLLIATSGTYLISKSRWKMECPIGLAGVLVTAPDGTKYTMTQFDTQYDPISNGQIYSYYTTRIEDTKGNWINIAYNTNYGFTYINQITSSDTRTVD